MAKNFKEDVGAELKRRREVSKRTKHTFRFQATLMEEFRKLCLKQDLEMTEVLEELIRRFVGRDYRAESKSEDAA